MVHCLQAVPAHCCRSGRVCFAPPAGANFQRPNGLACALASEVCPMPALIPHLLPRLQYEYVI